MIAEEFDALVARGEARYAPRSFPFRFFTVEAQPRRPGRKTRRWTVTSRCDGDVLGVIEWYGPWRQFCFFPEEGSVWSKGCLEDVQIAIARIKKERRDG